MCCGSGGTSLTTRRLWLMARCWRKALRSAGVSGRIVIQVSAGAVIVGGGTWLSVSGAAGLAVWALATLAVMPSRMSTSTKVQRARRL